jgi:hypothetical protein
MARRLAAVCLGVPLSGCAAYTQDVDLYYRQQAAYFQEAIDQAKVDATGLEHQAKVLAVTGDQAKLRKYRRSIEKIRDQQTKWEREKKRFDEAAEKWESRFHLARPALGGASMSAIPSEPSGTLEPAPSDNALDTKEQGLLKPTGD